MGNCWTKLVIDASLPAPANIPHAQKESVALDSCDDCQSCMTGFLSLLWLAGEEEHAEVLGLENWNLVDWLVRDWVAVVGGEGLLSR